MSGRRFGRSPHAPAQIGRVSRTGGGGAIGSEMAAWVGASQTAIHRCEIQHCFWRRCGAIAVSMWLPSADVCLYGRKQPSIPTMLDGSPGRLRAFRQIRRQSKRRSRNRQKIRFQKIPFDQRPFLFALWIHPKRQKIHTSFCHST